MTAPEPTKAITIFYCYAPADKALRNEIGKHLSPLKRQGLISEWDDRNIQPGMEWVQEIETHLNVADIVLLLISPDFLNSDYCYHVEMRQAMERHEQGNTCVIPIILRSCLWQDTPFGKLQALPASGKPIVGGGRNRDETLKDVARGINDAVKILLSKNSKINETTLTPKSRPPVQKKEDATEVLLVSDTVTELAYPLTGIDKNLDTQMQSNPSLPELVLPEKRDALMDISTDENATFFRKFHSKRQQTYQKRSYRYVLVGLTVFLLISLILLSWQYSAFIRNIMQNQILSKNIDNTDNPLEVTFSATESKLWFIPNNPAQYTLKDFAEQHIGGLYTDGHHSAPLYHLYFELRNLSKEQYSDIFIQEIKLKILRIRPLPQRPVPLWMDNNAFHYESPHEYEALYLGTGSGFILADYIQSDYLTHKPGIVTISPGETERIDVHIISRREVDILFSVQVTYFFAAESLPRTLTLTPTFEVIFADKSDTNLYQLREGHFVQNS